MDCEVNNGSSLRDECITNLLVFGFLQSCSDNSFRRELDALGHELPVLAPQWEGYDEGSVSKGEETIMSVIKPDMKIKLRMEGNVNGHAFVIEGEGSGKPFEGIQTIDLEVKEGAPLPFAYDILTTAFHYGNRVFTKYPEDIPDYFKQSFPEGYSWERSMTYEDGGICIATNDITMEEDSFINKIHFKGTNFPPNGPVMQKRTVGWEVSTEKMYVRDGVLKGDVKMKLLLKGGSHYRCDFRTTYKVKQKAVKLPDYHFVDHRIEILSHDKDYNKVKLYEHAVARNSTDSMDELYKGTLQTDGNRSSHSRLGRIEADSESQEDIIRNIARHLAQVGDSMDRSIPPGLVNGLALQLRNTSRSEEDRNRDLATALEQLLQAYPRDMEKEKTMLVLALLLAKKVASNTPSLLRDVFHTTVNFINQNLRTYVRSLARNGMTEFLQPVPLNAWLLRLNK
nr:NBid-mMaple-CBid [Cloning vector pcDNA-NBid-mMaple-CBid]